MAITAANKVAENGAPGTANYVTTATLTPSTNKLYLLAVTNRVTTAPPNTPTVTGGGGLTWVQVATLQVQAGTRRITLFRAMKPSGLTSGTVTIAFAGQSQTNISVSIDEFSGVNTTGTDGSGAIVQSATAGGNGTTATVALAAFGDATNNAAYMATHNQSNALVTPEAGYTELSDQSPSPSLEIEWKIGQDTSVTSTWAAAANWGAIAAEIAAQSGTLNTISLAGSITPTGALKKVAGKKLAGSITPTGTLKKAVFKKLAGGITPTGALAIHRLKFLFLSGAITPVGTLTTRLTRRLHLAGSITPIGTLRKLVSKKVSGGITPVGSLKKRISKRFAGSIIPVGTLLKSKIKSIVDFFVVITKAPQLASDITQVILAPIVTVAQSLGIPVFQRSAPSAEITQNNASSTDITQP